MRETTSKQKKTIIQDYVKTKNTHINTIQYHFFTARNNSLTHIKKHIKTKKRKKEMNVKGIAKELSDFDREEKKEIIQNMLNDEDDFEVGDYRFISNDKIDNIQVDELSSDTYILGCFTAWFIADITGLDLDVIEKAQKDESFELLGQLMLKEIEKVQEKYSSADGYGHHFASYDGHEHEAGDYYYFKIN